MIHDFIATARHLVFFAPPLRLRVLPLLLGKQSFGDSLQWQPSEGTEVIVVPIDTPSQVRRFTVEPFFQWHFVNAYERSPSELVVDYIRLPDFASHAWLGQVPQGRLPASWDGRYHRAVLDPAAGRFRSEACWDAPCEFPRVAPARFGAEHRFVYLASSSSSGGAGLFDQIVKFDTQTGVATPFAWTPGQYPSEPVFVHKERAQTEDDGYLLVLVYDARAHASHVAVLDARQPGAAPMARAHFDHHVPFTFHGNFVRS
jgi:all-trans-8'-apo-beta-carotenal 15,15'-oxygenase